MTSGIKTLFGG